MGAKRKILSKLAKKLTGKKTKTKTKKKTSSRKPRSGQRAKLREQVKSAGVGNTVAGSRRRKAGLQAVKDRMSARKRAKGRSLGSRGKQPGKPLTANPRKLDKLDEANLRSDLRKQAYLRKLNLIPRTNKSGGGPGSLGSVSSVGDQTLRFKRANLTRFKNTVRSRVRKEKKDLQKNRGKWAGSKWRSKADKNLMKARLDEFSSNTVQAVRKEKDKLTKARKKVRKRAKAMKSRLRKPRYPRKKMTRN
tara:strand:+ start:524 stop:1267 length:744 start_codon:yes stop_codon:yes gene_type:complete